MSTPVTTAKRFCSSLSHGLSLQCVIAIVLYFGIASSSHAQAADNQQKDSSGSDIKSSYIYKTASQAAAAPVGSGDIGTVSAVDNSGTISFVPWGKTDADIEKVATKAETAVSVAAAAAKVADVKAGMWIKFDEIGGDGEAKRVSAGQFLAEDGDKLVIFKALPGEFLQRDVKDWYTNKAGGIRFKVQLMRSSGDPKIPGANLRPASYKEPAGGFVFYLPLTLKGGVLNYGGPKPGMTVPDADGKIVINKDTVTETYWRHPRNPNKPDLGSVSGLTELTIRKLPKAMP